MGSPDFGAVVPVGQPLTLSIVAANGEAGNIISVELSLDAGQTWQLVATREWSTYTFTPTTVGPLTMVTRASTPSVTEVPTRFKTIKVVADTCPCMMQWPGQVVRPPEEADNLPVEVGTRFQVDRDGAVTGAMFAMFTETVGQIEPRVAHLWAPDGTLLASGSTARHDGYPYVPFDEPVPVLAGETYTVSYFTPVGLYAQTVGYFSSEPIHSGPFTLGEDAGVYQYGGGFPDQTWRGANYWVDPVFAD